MWVFCEVPGRHVSLSLQVGAGETRSDFTRAKVRPPSWSRSGPHLFPTRPLTSRLSQRPRHPVAMADHPLRGSLPVFPGGRKMPVSCGRSRRAPSNGIACAQGGFPAHSWQARPAHPTASYMWAPFAGGPALGWLWGLALNVST